MTGALQIGSRHTHGYMDMQQVRAVAGRLKYIGDRLTMAEPERERQNGSIHISVEFKTDIQIYLCDILAAIPAMMIVAVLWKL